ncbi:cytochrome P450 [Nocardiopsis sp. RSe5-2]|uniref:Cytochrome P450 n=1 Tax=Nocardiopsis endophytica TaxID=3018445 RepID=A0ABT4TXJ5_9ACTN|nr:cytochrome P450 [Nocardiopsis endophytica]MDA2809394.1 cytochrome P450 [Nocardiopsis endophytica]
MTDTAATNTADLPEYPAPRDAACPFDPAPAARAEQAAGALRRVRMPTGQAVWLVTGHAEQRTLLGDARLSSDVTNENYPLPVDRPRPEESSVGFILMDDPEHARLRRMVASPFTVKRVQALRPAVQRIVDERIDAMLAGPNRADLVQDFALPVPSLVICELLGVPYADYDFFQRNSAAVINRDTPLPDRDAAMGALFSYLAGLVDDKAGSPADDVLSGLAQRVRDGEIDRNEAAKIGVLLLIAGHETTANMIALGTVALLEHPAQLERVREGDEATVASAVEELLRYLTVIQSGLRRVALEDIEVAGETIRAGDGVLLGLELGNRDARVFEDPDTLDVHRGARNHSAFGFGVHQCLGQQLARMELQVAYGTLYKRIPSLKLAVDAAELPFKHDGQVYGVYELPVTW